MRAVDVSGFSRGLNTHKHCNKDGQGGGVVKGRMGREVVVVPPHSPCSCPGSHTQYSPSSFLLSFAMLFVFLPPSHIRRPEFVNRVDEFIVFEPLVRSQIRDIVGLRASALVARIAAQHITLQLGDSALEFLAAKVSKGAEVWLLV